MRVWRRDERDLHVRVVEAVRKNDKGSQSPLHESEGTQGSLTWPGTCLQRSGQIQSRVSCQHKDGRGDISVHLGGFEG